MRMRGNRDMLPEVAPAAPRWRRVWLWLGVLAAAGVLVALVVVTSALARWWSGPQAIRVGRGPDALAVTPDGRTLYAADWGRAGLWKRNGDTVTPVSVATGMPGDPIRVGNQPHALAMTPDG